MLIVAVVAGLPSYNTWQCFGMGLVAVWQSGKLRASVYVSSIIILLQLVLIYLLCHLLGLTDSLGLLFWDLTHCQQYLRYIKVAFHGIIFPNDLLGLGKCNYCSMASLTMTIKFLLELCREIY